MSIALYVRFQKKRPPPVKGKEEDYIYSSLISSFSNTKLFLIYYYLFFNSVYLSVPAHRSPRAIKTGENYDGEIAVRRITITLNKWTHKSVESEFARAKSEWQRKPFRTTEKEMSFDTVAVNLLRRFDTTITRSSDLPIIVAAVVVGGVVAFVVVTGRAW